MGKKNPKSRWWNDEKAAVRRKEVLAANNEEAKERCMEAYREEKRKVKRGVYIRAKKEISEEFGRKMWMGIGNCFGRR